MHAAVTCPGPAGRPHVPAGRRVRKDRIRFVSARGKREEKNRGVCRAFWLAMMLQFKHSTFFLICSMSQPQLKLSGEEVNS